MSISGFRETFYEKISDPEENAEAVCQKCQEVTFGYVKTSIHLVRYQIPSSNLVASLVVHEPRQLGPDFRDHSAANLVSAAVPPPWSCIIEKPSFWYFRFSNSRSGPMRPCRAAQRGAAPCRKSPVGNPR
jgi:hypothetical protein